MKKNQWSHLGILLVAMCVVAESSAVVCSVNNGLIQPPNPDIQLNGVAGVPGLVIGVGEPDCKFNPAPGCNSSKGVVYVNGVATPLPNNTAQLNAVSVASTNYAVAVGDNKNGMPVALVQFNGTTWTAMPTAGTEPSSDANGVKTYGPNQTYVVGDQGIYFFNGTTWTRQLSTNNVPIINGQNVGKFEAVWGDATNVYALADNGALYTKDVATPPTAWTRITAAYPAGANKADFQAITGDAAGNIYVTGQTDNNKGFVYQYNPTTGAWTNLITTAGTFDFNGIAINPSTGAITAVGDNGGQITSGPNGAAPWTQIPEANNTNDINAVYIDPNGSIFLAGQTANACTPPVTGPDHILIQHTGSGLTCSPSTITLRACAQSAAADPTCANLYTGGGVTVTPAPAGVAVTIGVTGIATTTVQQATAGTATLTATANPAAAAATTCSNTVANTASCAMTFSDAGFVVTVPNHTSCTNATATIEAVQTGGAGRCVPAYQNVTRSVNLSFAYTSPVSGTQSINVLSGSNLATITTAPTTHTLTFDNVGTATLGLSYADAGQLTLTASATAPTGAAMTGSGAFIAAPASFAFSGIPAAPLKAGQAFNATVTAMNACATPTATANFNGTVALTSSNPLPALGNATAINTTAAAFTNGVSNTDLTWDEVGTIDLTANLSAYLGWTLPTAVATTQLSVGRFQPAYFETLVTPVCGAFTYAGSVAPAKTGQPITVKVTACAKSANCGKVTKNYDGTTYNTAFATTLSNAGITTGLVNNVIPASGFANGSVTLNASSVNKLSYNMATPEVESLVLMLRATDADSVAVTSTGHESGTEMRSGRVAIENAYGSELLNMPIPLTAQYYKAAAWRLNDADSCSSLTLPALTLQPSGSVVNKTFSSPLISGKANLELTSPSASGYVDITPTLDTWLQYRWDGTTLGNPTGRATFGVYKGNNTFIYRGRRGR
ncbi:MAG: hypothetical protein PHY62_09485 [Gallionella sp.]|nr:hypothetical protein [Gallionella sp.]